MLVRADSAFYGRPTISAATRAGTAASVTVRMEPEGKATMERIDDHTWTTIEHTDVVFDEETQAWIARAEVAEIPFTRIQLPQSH